VGRYIGRCANEDCSKPVFDDGDGYHDYSDELECVRCRKYRQSRSPRGPESPIEYRFLECWQQRYPDAHIQPQFWIGNYRVDFALPAAMIVIELDGAVAHSSPWAIEQDRVRQQHLEALGWYFIRFTGSEINRDVADCVARAADEIVDRLWSLARRGTE
jgi:very-short-patch-repair endonuclease